MAESKNTHAAALSAHGASKGGVARAEALSSERRSEVARQAAMARWGTDLPRETHDGILEIGDLRIGCSVLDNGQRVLSASAVSRAFGSGKKGRSAGGADGSPQIPPFLTANNVKTFISDKLLAPLTSPILFRPKHAGRPALGYEATLLPQICEAILDARNAGALLQSQMRIAAAAELLLRGFARVGVIALVDEATGYQADRARDALAKILEKFIAKELRPWVRTFPAEFYQQMFRLRGWEWKGMSVNRPQAVAHYTKDLVYARLAPGVLEELKRVTPRAENGRPKAKLFQSLTDDIGHPKLREHLAAVVALMRISKKWDSFMQHVDRALPRFGDTVSMFPPDPES
jgi:hypothetical protein